MQLPEFYWNWEQHNTSDLVEIGETTAILMLPLWKDFYERSGRQCELRLCELLKTIAARTAPSPS